VFVLAGLAKVRRRDTFERAIQRYDLVPAAAAGFAARWLPIGEVSVAALLATGVATVPAAASIAILLLLFIVAVTVNLLRGRDIDCGCFGGGVAPQRITWFVVARNVLLLAMAVFVGGLPPRALAVLPGWEPSSSAVATGDATAMLIIGTLSVVASLTASEAWTLRRRLLHGRFQDA
jgi:hypothetical protein